MDPVEAFFAELLRPQQHEAHVEETGNLWGNELAEALALLCTTGKASKDPDHEFLTSRIPACVQSPHGNEQFDGEEFAYFWDVLAHLALSKTPAELQGESAKARWLRYLRWIAQGRKDVERDAAIGCKAASNGTSHEIKHLADLSRLSENGKHACASCHKVTSDDTTSEAVQLSKCAGCVIPVAGYGAFCTYYCSQECQAADWPRHKTFCNARKAIVRAAALLQSFLYTLEAHASFSALDKLYVRDGVTLFEEVSREQMYLTGGSVLQRLTCDNPPSDMAYHAALMGSKCNDPILVGRLISQTLLGPLCKDIKQVTFIPRNAVDPVCIVNDDKDHAGRRAWEHVALVDHSVLQLTLPSGEVLALDVAAAQYGWRECLAPWDAYHAQRVLGVVDVADDPFSRYRSEMMRSMVCSADRVHDTHRQDMAAALLRLLREECATVGYPEAGGSFARMARHMSAQKYEAWKAALEERARELCAAAVQRPEGGGPEVPRWYMDRTWWRCVTSTPEQRRALEGVWLTEEDVTGCGGDGVEMRKIWTKRCMKPERQARFKQLGMDMNFRRAAKRIH